MNSGSRFFSHGVGCMYLMSMYYRRYELQWRFNLFFSAVILAGAWSGVRTLRGFQKSTTSAAIPDPVCSFSHTLWRRWPGSVGTMAGVGSSSLKASLPLSLPLFPDFSSSTGPKKPSFLLPKSGCYSFVA